jgi:hypothetical protein
MKISFIWNATLYRQDSQIESMGSLKDSLQVEQLLTETRYFETLVTVVARILATAKYDFVSF